MQRVSFDNFFLLLLLFESNVERVIWIQNLVTLQSITIP